MAKINDLVLRMIPHPTNSFDLSETYHFQWYTIIHIMFSQDKESEEGKLFVYTNSEIESKWPLQNIYS